MYIHLNKISDMVSLNIHQKDTKLIRMFRLHLLGELIVLIDLLRDILRSKYFETS